MAGVDGLRRMGDRMSVSEVSVVAENLPESQIGLTIEVPPDRVDEAFRERSVEAIDRPRVEVQELERGRAARLVAKVSIWPQVKLADLDGLGVERPTTTVDDEMVERRLTELREQLAEVEPVEREVRAGDVVVGDLMVSVDGVDVPEEARQAIELEVKEGVLVPELRAVLPGKKQGEVATAVAQMPDDHTNERLRGRAAELQVTVQGVKEKRLPELTDEVAQRLSDGERQTAEQLRRAVREDLEAAAGRLDELAYERKVVQAVVEGSEIDIPRALVQRELDREMDDLEHRLGHQGLRLSRYLEYLDKSPDTFRAEREPEARDRIRADLVLGEASKQLGVSPTDDEVSAYIRSEAEKDEEVRRQLDQLLENRVAREYFEHRLTRLKTLEALVARASGEGTVGAGLVPTAAADEGKGAS